MDERDFDRIDRYVRGEMSSGESLNFEQDALNNPELLKETELVYRLKRSLTDRQRKLHKTNAWERKRRYRSFRIAGIAVAAAAAALFVFVIPSDDATDMSGNTSGSFEVVAISETEKQKSEVVETVRKAIDGGKEEEAIRTIDGMERANIIPNLDELSGKYTATVMSEDTSVMNVKADEDAYELYWLKIKSLIKIGKKAEAVSCLKTFTVIGGQYKAEADSLLKELEK